MGRIANFAFHAGLYITNHAINRIPSHSIRQAWYKGVWRCAIGRQSYIFMGTVFDTRGAFKLGPGSVVNQNCRLDNRGGIAIGSSVSISADVIILTADHDPNSRTFEGRCRPVVIDDYVFVGTRAMILPGVTLGKGSVVAAGAVVTKSVAPYSIVAGVPAKTIGQRTPDLDYSLNYGRLFF